ncbi:5'-nucleotidase/apyrase family protein [Candidatus Thioglobus sp.]|nr:bifunctional metallophosphatase/5'-nucleotidase [Candidatus Thioglobus sp.]MDA8981514.1 5'-nucleotidase/apyrase family protein [Candidatus Thioglobus sp.]MDB4057411.1 5'-nucleotidase/apyrase family protein [Candidatus Thioglobus sp.]MDB4140088.1 5'-nucleotidase/apyrase family protein [Candidatus Thioglobus sp.]MDB9803149.1 5'-nucleotidase/apyrase family protein [Candidatus Thioglobus sp.]MDB9933951.1 5'-nucleotidase/apyrase family protein [Candidatus Thioglobus sp.]
MKHLYKMHSIGLQKIIPGVLLSFFVTLGFFSQSSIAASHKVLNLTILHTNDFHARFRPISKYDNNCSAENNAEGKCFGGSARLITAIEDARSRHENTVLLDGGDQFQGTLFYNLYKGKVAAEMMNKLGYDGMTVGNHEFDDGPETLRAFMDAVNFPVLMANANVDMEPELKGKLQKSTVIERSGHKIGLIGLVTEDVVDISSPGDNIIFTDAITAAQAEVDSLTAAGVGIIILMSHSSYEIDKEIAANTTGIDVIVGGHDNAYLSNISDRAKGPYPTVVNGTQIVQAYAYGKYLGELSVVFDDEGEVISATGEPITIDGSVNENSQIVARLDELEKPITDLKETLVGNVSSSLNGDRAVCRVQECDMGNMITDAMRAAGMEKGYSIALANSGGIRASLDAGQVTLGEIMTILPFQNTMSTFKVTGKQLLAAIENGVSQVEDGSGRFPQVSGMRFSFDASKPANERVTSIEIQESNGSFSALNLYGTYGMVSNNFIRAGGDGYKMFRSATDIYDFGPDLADVVVDYIKANPGYSGFTDNRITQVK